MVLGGTLFVLLLLSLGGTFLTYGTQSGALHKLATLFLFEEERNLPTVFNVFLLVAAAAALGTVAMFRFASGDRWRWHWLFLAAWFLLMSYDEAAQVHEKLGTLVEGVTHTTGFLAFAWVIPGMAAVLVIGLAFVRFLLALPGRSALLFLVAGAMYVFGAIGMEMIEAKVFTQTGLDTATFSLLATVEETFEMAGLIVLLHATLGILTGPGGALRVDIQPTGHRDI